jgi:hypothetical protein
MLNELAILSNEPPGGVADPLRERLDEIYQPLADRQQQLIRAEPRIPEVFDDDSVLLAGDLARQARACVVQVEKAHKVEKAPFLRSCQTVDGWRRDLADPLNRMIETIRLRAKRYQDRKAAAERARLAAEARRKEEEAEKLRKAGRAALAVEAEHEAAEARKHAAAPTSELVRARTPMAGLVTVRELPPSVEITDKILAVNTLAELIDHDAVVKAARLWAKQHGREKLKRKLERGEQPLAGVRFTLDTSAEFR